jgi:hypothetical protein
MNGEVMHNNRGSLLVRLLLLQICNNPDHLVSCLVALPDSLARRRVAGSPSTPPSGGGGEAVFVVAAGE